MDVNSVLLLAATAKDNVTANVGGIITLVLFSLIDAEWRLCEYVMNYYETIVQTPAPI